MSTPARRRGLPGPGPLLIALGALALSGPALPANPTPGPAAFPSLHKSAVRLVNDTGFGFQANESFLPPEGDLPGLPIRLLETHANGDRSVAVDDPDGGWSGHLTLGNGAMFGELEGPGGRYLFTTDGGGLWRVRLPDTGVSFNTCGTAHSSARSKAAPRDPDRTQVATATVIDLLIIYNAPLAQRYPGAILETRLNHLVHIANQAMANSGLDAGVRLVGHRLFDYRNDNENAQYRNDIAATLGGNTRPGLAGLAALRDQLGADLVIGLRPHDLPARGSCGIAFFPEGDPNLGVNVVSDGSDSWSFCLDDTFTHEIGHNIGATHQVGAGGGFIDPRGSAFVQSGRFTTVMGSFGTGRSDRFRGLPLFSTPSLPCGNEPCGNFADTDNVTVIRTFLDDVAAYRPTRSALPLPQRLTRSSEDQDGDGVIDWLDALPFDASERFDSDRDGRGDNSDAFPGSAGEQDDTDGDGIGDNADTDDDGDGVPDLDDAFPLDALEVADADGDGVGDVGDVFPGFTPEYKDTDGDGTGDNADADDDGDGVREFDPVAEDLLVVSVGNSQVLRFDAATGASRGVEVPAWDSLLTWQTSLARRSVDNLLVYGGNSALRRMNLLDRSLLGEWVPSFVDDASVVQLNTGFPQGLAAVEGGNRLVTVRFENPQLLAFRGRERPRSDPASGLALDPLEDPGDIAALGPEAWVVGRGTRSLYTVSALETTVLAGPGLSWMFDPRRLFATTDGRLLLGDRQRNAVLAIDRATGAFLGELARLGPAGYSGPEGLALTKDGTLLVAASDQDAILAFDGSTGEFLGPRVSAGAGGLDGPGHLVLVPALRDRFGSDPARQFRPNPGLWYDPASDGRGFDIQYYGTRLSVIWYSYDEAGLPTWTLAAGDLDGASFDAPLLRFTLAPDGTATSMAVGRLALDFTTERRADVSWQIDGIAGKERLEWLVFTPGVRPVDDTGLWGREDGPGWGVSLANQGEVSVAVAYVYDAEGAPRWAISEPVTGEPPYALDMLASFAPGLCPGCDGDGGNELVPAGTMALSVREAPAWSSDIVFPAPLDGAWSLDEVPLRLFSLPSIRPR